MKAPRNKTIDISVEEGREYLERCLQLSAPTEHVLDKTLLGDSLEVMGLLPRGFVDLAIIDPPYNLYKDFGGNKFSRMGEEAYEQYTEKWLCALLPLIFGSSVGPEAGLTLESEPGQGTVCTLWLPNRL